jgi:hypothetical protein
MDESTGKLRSKINMCTYRRLNIEHEINENLCKQNYSSNLHFYKYREQLFNQKVNHLRKAVEHIEPVSTDEEESSFMTSNSSSRIQNQFRMLNFSSKTEKRLSCQFPNIPRKRNSNEMHHRYSHGGHKTFQSYINQQIFDEQKKQIENVRRKSSLMKEFDELKHTINDPHSTISVLAALSRAIIFLDSATE